MATRVFTDEELERLREFPEIGRDELVRYFTLTSPDLAFIDPGRGRGPAERLGLSVALCTLPWLGFVPLVQPGHRHRPQSGDYLRSLVPLGRYGTSDEVAAVVTFLVSSKRPT
ncbi:transposase [Streptomyces sp. PRh5]|uniref:DUF4158 domain-containing protein n=1 Tax=Streptomyces sp. PRh5 TaxID=1158056 RepID=UPI0004452947|nr:DUF4158 domain-containing protein [Streptomyces sp. PRh5]EXU64951.1 transposase [Streptomyces sp. PRh5]